MNANARKYDYTLTALDMAVIKQLGGANACAWAALEDLAFALDGCEVEDDESEDA